MKTTKKILAVVLSVMLLLSVMPFAAFAAASYGNYVVADGDNGEDLWNKEVYFNDMAWYVIEDNSTDTNAGSLTLLAKSAIGSSQFYTSSSSASDMSYNGSTVKAYLDGLTAEGGAFEDVADAILPTTLTTYGYDSTDVYETTENAKLYLLSVSEASELPMRVKMLGDSAGNYWWLRSPGYYDEDGARVAYVVTYDVIASGSGGSPTTSNYVRPALNLDLSKVEFDSSLKEFSILAEEEASTVSFTKAASANDITAENIGTCTFAEAKAWILDNWVSVTNTQQYFVDVVYFDENGVFSVIFITPESMSKVGFNNDCNEADTSYTVDGIRGDVSSYGDDAWLCTPPAPTTGFMVGSDHFDDLEDAIAAAKAGSEKTVTFLEDVDFTVYPSFTRHTLDLTGVTLDLDGHTITGYNHSVVYVGDNFTIKNGNMVCVYDSVNNKKESYAAVIYPQVGNWQTDVVTDKSTGVVLENLVLTGGINCFGADVTVRGENTNVTGNYYYALWADVLATLTVEDGTFTSAASSTNGIIGACSDAGKEAYVDISGGEYTVPAGKNLVLQSTMASSQQLVEISGGTYNVVVPAKACAEGFVPVTEPNAQGKYTVAVVQYGTIEQMTGATITGNGTAHEKITISNVNLNYADPDYSVGRYYAGYYLSGVKFIAPEGTVISENARYTNGSIDSTTGQLKVKNLYTAKDGANYMYSWPHVTEESLKEAIAAGVNKTWEYTFDWDGDGIFEQEAIIEIVCDTVTLVKDGQQIYPVPANNGANLTLLGDIEEAIYLDADAYNLGSDAVVKVTANANSNISETPDVQTKTYAVSSLTPFVDPDGNYTGTYKFAVKNAPAQITEKVTVALYASADAQEPVETIEYSVKDYCDTVIEKSNNAKLVALCKSILDYGAAAQAEFNYNTDNMAVDEFYNADAIAALTYSDITGTYLSGDLAISGCAFQCLANTNINLYIDAPLDSKNIQATIEGDEDSAIAANYMRSNKNGRLFISVNGIEAGNMNKNFTVITSNGAVTTNIRTIIKTCLYYGTAQTLAKTIYFYANAADAYFN